MATHHFCSFVMPPLDLNAGVNAQYSSVTLALVQRVNMDEAQQTAQILMGTDMPATKLLKQESGRQPRMRSVYTVTRDDLLNQTGANGNFQLLFKAYSGVAPTPNKGWQIESIAILGNTE